MLSGRGHRTKGQASLLGEEMHNEVVTEISISEDTGIIPCGKRWDKESVGTVVGTA